MNRQLAETVIATLRGDKSELVRRRFAQFDEREWQHTRTWLHTSGLALYFLDRATRLGLEDAMPAALLHEFAVNLAENRVRTADLFDEFVRLNVDFQRAGISYANLKGFTLVPHACADPAFRYQHDLDFLVSRRDAERCRQALERHSYKLTTVFGDTWEFRAGPAEVCSMRDLYRVRAQRSLEVHLVPEAEEEISCGRGNRLSRLQLQVWNGLEFPALCECDKLLSQAMHLFKHFQTEWTRAAWLLEYANAIRAHRDEEALWSEVAESIDAAPEMRIGAGMATLVTARTFGMPLPREFAACTVEALPPPMRLWADRYEQDLVLTEHPGSKLYLLLQDVLLNDRPEWRAQRRRRLVPLRLPPKVVAARSNSLSMRWKTGAAQLRFTGKRFWFHLTAGLRYKVEAARWRRFVAGAQL